jgi:membrane protein implicated in regulation of membrane protease activity
MDTGSPSTPEIQKIENPAPVEEQKDQKKSNKWLIAIGIIIPVLLLIAGLVYLFIAPAAQTARIRDIFIILMAFMTLAIGLVLIILIVQIAELTNLLKTEVKPVLDSVNDTANNLRGTTEFLGKNMVEPVVKLNEYAAALKRIFELINLGRKPK